MNYFIGFSSCFGFGIYLGMVAGQIFTPPQVGFIISVLFTLICSFFLTNAISTPALELRKQHFGLNNPFHLLLLGLFFISLGTARYQIEVFITNPNHIAKHMERWDKAGSGDESSLNPVPFQNQVRLKGFVDSEPDRRQDKTVIYLRPFELSFQESTIEKGGQKEKNSERGAANRVITQKVSGGLVYITLKPTLKDYLTLDYGQELEISGRLSHPMESSNPGGFDFGEYLKNRGVYACVYNLYRNEDLKILSRGSEESFLYRNALVIKKKFLAVLKETMPFPESAFLGGVTLGLRRGLPPKVNEDFKKTGVSHVLAVSGLHITIIAVMFYGLFSLTPLSKKVFTPIIVFLLFTFAMIVGWPPSAVRAAMMNSLALLFLAYFKDLGLKSSVLFSLSLAGTYILVANPLFLLEPSFTLSFIAILSLVLLTGPFQEMLNAILIGKGFALGIFGLVGYYSLIALDPTLTTHSHFFANSLIFIFFLGGGCYFLSLEEPANNNFRYSNLPPWLSGFIASQFAILFGMMAPLSAIYFHRLSLSSPLANFIAIPLITLIVQLGLCADILGATLPLIGSPLALIINASNWLLVKFFLMITTLFSFLFPYPYICKPTLFQTLFYYSILVAFIFSPILKAYLGNQIPVLSYLARKGRVKFQLWSLGVCFLATLFFGLHFLSEKWGIPQEDLRITIQEVGFGNSIVFESPDHLLVIDGGEGASGEFNTTENTLFPYLLSRRKNHLDYLVVSSPDSHLITGSFKIIQHLSVGEIIHPFARLDKNLSFQDYLEMRKISEGDLKYRPLIIEEWNYYKDFSKWVNERKIPHKFVEKTYQLKVGETSYTFENINGAIAVLSKSFEKSYGFFSNHFRKGMISFPQIFDGTKELDGLTLPSNGIFDQSFEELIQRFKPKNIFISSGKPDRDGPIFFSPTLFLKRGKGPADLNDTILMTHPLLVRYNSSNGLNGKTIPKGIENNDEFRVFINYLIEKEDLYTPYSEFIKPFLTAEKWQGKPPYSLIEDIQKLILDTPRTLNQKIRLNRYIIDLLAKELFIGTRTWEFKKNWYLSNQYSFEIKRTRLLVEKFQIPLFETNPGFDSLKRGAIQIFIQGGLESISQQVDHTQKAITLPPLVNHFVLNRTASSSNELNELKNPGETAPSNDH